MIKYRSKKRIYNLFILFVIIFGILIYRIFKFQFFDAKKLSVMAESQYTYMESTRENKWLLLDSKGRDLLKYKDKYYAVIVPDSFKENQQDKNEDKILSIIYTLRNYNKDYDITKIQSLDKSGKIYYKIDKNTYEKLEKMKNIKGFYVYKKKVVDKGNTEKKEYWKLENMLLNPYKNDGRTLKDKNTLEMNIYNKVKNNENPKIIYKKDLSGKIISSEIKNTKSNINPKLTLDYDIQEKIKKVLLKDEYKSFDQIGVILMESNTGKIKSMIQKDETLPNINIGAATQNGFPPGSIFKVLVEEAGIEKDIIATNDKFTCKSEFENNHKSSHGTLSVRDAFIVSCNHIFSQIGMKVGFENINYMIKKHGLYDKVLNLQQEQKGYLELKGNKEPNISDGTLPLLSFGQLIRITPIESIAMVNTVVNDGIYVKPYILEGYVNDNNEVIEKLNTKEERIITKNTANIMKNQMLDVVRRGTAKGAYDNNIEIGGKTGTNQRSEVNKDNKLQNYSDGWFIGFFKSNGVYYSMVVFIPNINAKEQSAGSTAVPIFYDIVKNIKDSI